MRTPIRCVSVSFFTCAALTACITTGCTKKKKGDEGTKQPAGIVTLTPTASPTATTKGEVVAPTAVGTTAGNGGNVTTGGTVPEGTTGSGSMLSRSDIGLAPTTVPTSTQPALEAELMELSRTAHLFELSPRAPQGVTLSDLESKTETCVRSAIDATRFNANAAGFTLVTTFDYKKCIEDAKPVGSQNGTTKWSSSVQWAMRARCDNYDFTPFNGKQLTDPDTLRYLCYDSSAGEFYAHVKLNAEELDASGKTLRSYVRSRALVGKTKDTCGFTLTAGKRAYDDCVWVDRTNSHTGIVRYVEIGLDAGQSVSQFDTAGQKFAGSKVNATYNNWKGPVEFPADAALMGTYTLSNGTTQAKGTNTFPWPVEYQQPSQIFKGQTQQQQGQMQQQQGGTTPTAQPTTGATTSPDQSQNQPQQQQGN